MAAAVARLGVERPVVIGHSFGAPLAVAWAAEAPGGRRGGVLAGGDDRAPAAPRRGGCCRSTARWPRRSRCGAGRRHRCRCRDGWCSGGSSAWPASRASTPRWAATMLRDAGRAAPVVPGVLPALATLDLAALCAAVDVPASVIWGDLDRSGWESGPPLAAALRAPRGRPARRRPHADARGAVRVLDGDRRVPVGYGARMIPAARSDVWSCRRCGAPHELALRSLEVGLVRLATRGEEGFRLGSEGIEAELEPLLSPCACGGRLAGDCPRMRTGTAVAVPGTFDGDALLPLAERGWAVLEASADPRLQRLRRAVALAGARAARPRGRADPRAAARAAPRGAPGGAAGRDRARHERR